MMWRCICNAFIVKLTDGREFSASSSSGSLQGLILLSIFGSPILCTPKPGDYGWYAGFLRWWMARWWNLLWWSQHGDVVYVDMLSSYSGGPPCCSWTDSTEILNVPENRRVYMGVYWWLLHWWGIFPDICSWWNTIIKCFSSFARNFNSFKLFIILQH